MACTVKSFEDIEYCEGEHSLAGYYSDAYIIKESDILSFPKQGNDKLLTEAEKNILGGYGTLTESEKKLTLVGDIKMKAGKKFTHLPILNDSGQLEYTRPKSTSTAVKTDWSCDIQLTTHNEGVLDDVTRCILVLREIDGKIKVLGRIGAAVDLAEEKGKNSKGADNSRMISLKFSHAPFRAADYYGTIQLVEAP
jgi:hypothetical protein